MRCMSGSSVRCAIISMRCGDHEARRHEESSRPFVPSCLRGSCSRARLVVVACGCAAARVTFRAEDGATLTGAYYEPSRRPAPGIVLLHMLRRSHADWDAAASQLSDAGFAVVALDYPRRRRARRVRDRRAGGESISARAPGGDPGSIGIAGASIGANLAVLDAADDPGVLSIALLSPGSTTGGCAPKRR